MSLVPPSVALRGKRLSRRRTAALLGGAAAIALCGTAHAQMGDWGLDEMVDLGTLGGDYSYARDVSDDGSVIAGWAYVTGASNDHAVIWTEDGGISDLGTLGGNWSYAYGVSGDGAVVFGEALTGASYYHAFRYANGTMSDLGTLGGNYSYAYASSVDGSVLVGGSNTTGDAQTHAFRWTQGGGMVDLGTLGGNYSYAYDTNADGAVVIGYSHNASDYGRAFRWTQGGGMQDLGTLGGDYSYARNISRDGSAIAGQSNIAGNAAYHAFRWTEGGGMQDLGTLGGDYSYGEELSNDGSVVIGYARLTSGYYHAFRWTEAGGMQDLGVLADGRYSWGEDVSGDGAKVVGYAEVPYGEDYTSHAFLWTEQDGMVDLGTLGGRSSNATAISDDGSTIVGYSYIEGDTAYHAFVYRTQMQDYTDILASFPLLASTLQVAGESQRGLLSGAMDERCDIFNKGQTCLSVGAARRTFNQVPGGGADPQFDTLHIGLGHSMGMGMSAGGALSFYRISDPIREIDPGAGFMVDGWLAWAPQDGPLGPQLRVAFGFATQGNDINRGLGLTNIQVLPGSADLATHTYRVTAGYGFATGMATITPWVRLTGEHSRLGAFTEAPGDFPAAFDATRFSATYASVGADLGVPVGMGRIQVSGWLDSDMSSDPVILTGTSDIPGMNAFSVLSLVARDSSRWGASASFSHPVGAGVFNVGVGGGDSAFGQSQYSFGASYKIAID